MSLVMAGKLKAPFYQRLVTKKRRWSSASFAASTSTSELSSSSSPSPPPPSSIGPKSSTIGSRRLVPGPKISTVAVKSSQFIWKMDPRLSNLKLGHFK